MTKYAEQTKTIESLIENVNVKINKLDTLKKDLLSLDKVVTLEPKNNEQNKNNSLPNSENIIFILFNFTRFYRVSSFALIWFF